MAKSMYIICMSKRDSGLRNELHNLFQDRLAEVSVTTFLVKSNKPLTDEAHEIWTLFDEHDVIVGVARVYKKTLEFSVWEEKLGNWLRRKFPRVWRNKPWLH